MHCVMGRRWISQSLKWMTNKCTCPTWLCGELGCLKCFTNSVVINSWSAFNFYWILMQRCLIRRAVEPERPTWWSHGWVGDPTDNRIHIPLTRTWFSILITSNCYPTDWLISSLATTTHIFHLSSITKLMIIYLFTRNTIFFFFFLAFLK